MGSRFVFMLYVILMRFDRLPVSVVAKVHHISPINIILRLYTLEGKYTKTVNSVQKYTKRKNLSVINGNRSKHIKILA